MATKAVERMIVMQGKLPMEAGSGSGVRWALPDSELLQAQVKDQKATKDGCCNCHAQPQVQNRPCHLTLL